MAAKSAQQTLIDSPRMTALRTKLPIIQFVGMCDNGPLAAIWPGHLMRLCGPSEETFAASAISNSTRTRG